MTVADQITAYATDEAAAIRIERARIKAMERALADRTRALIVDHLQALTVREVAALVDLSPQRIGQLRPGQYPRGRRVTAETAETAEQVVSDLTSPMIGIPGTDDAWIVGPRPGGAHVAEMTTEPIQVTATAETADPMCGRASRSVTMHKLNKDGRPQCGDTRLDGQPMVNHMPLSAVSQRHPFLLVCSHCG